MYLLINEFLWQVRINSMIPHIGFFASRDIAIGEELTFSYGQAKYNDSSNQHSDSGLLRCNCGSSNCLGFLPFDTTC